MCHYIAELDINYTKNAKKFAGLVSSLRVTLKVGMRKKETGNA